MFHLVSFPLLMLAMHCSGFLTHTDCLGSLSLIRHTKEFRIVHKIILLVLELGSEHRVDVQCKISRNQLIQKKKRKKSKKNNDDV